MGLNSASEGAAGASTWRQEAAQGVRRISRIIPCAARGEGEVYDADHRAGTPVHTGFGRGQGWTSFQAVPLTWSLDTLVGGQEGCHSGSPKAASILTMSHIEDTGVLSKTV